MAIAQSFFSLTYNDNTINQRTGQPESGNVEFPTTTLTAANLTAQLVKIVALIDASNDLVVGVEAKNQIVLDRNYLGAGAAASVYAQRENKWLIRYHGATSFKKYHLSIPTADLSKLPATHTEFLDITAAEGLAFKTAFEAVVVAPDDAAEAVVLDSIQFVGRNT